jgi:hypothetical protein
MQLIRQAWAGKEKLWRVFWFGLLAPQIVAGIAMIGKVFIRGLGSGRWVMGQWWWHALIGSYYMFLLVMVWKCRANANRKVWGYLAIAYLVFILPAFALKAGLLINPRWLTDFPRTVF